MIVYTFILFTMIKIKNQNRIFLKFVECPYSNLTDYLWKISINENDEKML